MSRIFSLILLAIFITSCDEKKVIYIADHLADCQGVAKQKCMKVKENIEDDWQLFYDNIEGFHYKEGFTYKLEINVSKVENPPADGSSLKYKLIRLIYKEPSEQKVQTAQNLEGKWKIETLTGFDQLVFQPTLIFKDGQVAGNAACNNYASSYKIKGDEISFGIPMATKRMCANMKIEKTFFSYLNNAKSYKLIDSKLVIYDNNNKELLSCSSVND